VAKRVGYAPGIYDMFHVGHLNILKNASLHCDYLIAGVLTDEMAIRAKNTTPIIPFVERLEIVRSIRYVDQAVAETVPDKLETWAQVRFDVIIKGDDWKGTEKGRKLERDFASVGVEVVYLPYTVHTSSSTLRNVLDGLLRAASS
jgi:glycerol-3-phosphate cytidylyltransferase